MQKKTKKKLCNIIWFCSYYDYGPISEITIFNLKRQYLITCTVSRYCTFFQFEWHISGITRVCYYYICDMRRIRRFLTPSVAKAIASSLIGSELDYCNSVLFNVTEKEISKLQGVQNCLARVVTKSPRFCHITPLLKSLHWLRARYRIKFKLCSLTYQALTSGQPVYIRDML